MADKLSWTELRRALASRAGVTEKVAGTFLNALAEQLKEGLRTDKQVKINGLGTFKLQAVAPRKSVNINTGEEIVIEGYNKVVFSPEAGVKEMIESNQPSDVSHQPEEGDFPIDPIKKLGEQADEIVGLLADLGQDPGREEEPVAKPEPVVEPEPVIKPEPVVVPEPVVKPEPVVEPEPVVVPEPIVKPEPVVEPEPVIKPESVKEDKPKKPKKYHFLRDLLICVIVLLLLLGGGYLLIRNRLSSWLESLAQPQQPQTEQVEDTISAPPSDEAETESRSQIDMIPEGDIPQQQILDEFLAISDGIEQEEAPYSDLITTEEMHAGSRLTWMSKRFYGDKRYWPYLYDANRDRITNPSNIEIGTPIRVPRLTAEQLDTTNANSRAELERLRIEAEAACRK